MSAAASSPARVVVAGHVCVDLVPRLGGAVSLTPGRLYDVGPLAIRAGGCVANAGGDLAALGVPVRLAADAGDDELGRLLVDLLEAPRLDTSGVRLRSGLCTSYSVVCEPPGADRTFWHHVGANVSFDGSAVDLAGADLLHVGYPPLLPALCAGTPSVLAGMLTAARASGITTSVDLATIDHDAASARHWDSLLAEILPLVDVFAPSLDDLNAVLRRDVLPSLDSVGLLGAELVDLGAAVVLIKLGASGLYLRTAPASRFVDGGRLLATHAQVWAGRELWYPPLDVEVVGTTGAGDAAVAGLLYGIIAGQGPAEALATAAITAAARVSTVGALDPWTQLHGRLRDCPQSNSGAMPGWIHDGGVVRGPDDTLTTELEHAE